MTENTGGCITPGSYNEAKIALKGGDICIGQNPVMFVVLAVITMGMAALFFFLAGKGQMTINEIIIPPVMAKVVSLILAGVFTLAAAACISQALSPAMLVLSPERGTYKRTGGIIGKLMMRPVKQGSFTDFEKLSLVHESGQKPDGKPYECWRLTLLWKNSTDFNLGAFIEQGKAKQMANGFADKLKLPLEER